MNLITDFKQIPLGLHLTRAYYESKRSHVYTLSLKSKDDTYYNQPLCPVYSEGAFGLKMDEFWTWAKANLPIYDHQTPIKSAL